MAAIFSDLNFSETMMNKGNIFGHEKNESICQQFD